MDMSCVADLRDSRDGTQYSSMSSPHSVADGVAVIGILVPIDIGDE